MITVNDIEQFISHFAGSEDTFLHGCCYWFAHILETEFGDGYECSIVYEPVDGHFLFQIWLPITTDPTFQLLDMHLFDVRGDVTHLYDDVMLYDVEQLVANEPRWFSHLMRDCKDFIRPTDEELEVS